MDKQVKTALGTLEVRVSEQSDALNQLEEKLNILVTMKTDLKVSYERDEPAAHLAETLLNMARKIRSNTDRLKSIIQRMERSKAQRA